MRARIAVAGAAWAPRRNHGAISVIACLIVSGCSARHGAGGPGSSLDAGGGGDDGFVPSQDDGGPGGDDGDDASASLTSCDPSTKPGSAAGSESERTPGGLAYIVRVPPSYRASAGAPLIVVYAASGGTPSGMEAFTGLTPDAFARGYIVAYADHALADYPDVLTDAGAIPKRVSSKWCVDPKRVYLTGHSDGGSMAIGVEVNQFSPIAAVAPSAAGVSASTLQGIPCPSPPIATMIMHSSGDQLFPVSYGADETSWFASCDGCTGTGGARADGCLPRTGCAEGTDVVYCQGSAPHGVWPGLNASILDFFDAHRGP